MSTADKKAMAVGIVIITSILTLMVTFSRYFFLIVGILMLIFSETNKMTGAVLLVVFAILELAASHKRKAEAIEELSKQTEEASQNGKTIDGESQVVK